MFAAFPHRVCRRVVHVEESADDARLEDLVHRRGDLAAVPVGFVTRQQAVRRPFRPLDLLAQDAHVARAPFVDGLLAVAHDEDGLVAVRQAVLVDDVRNRPPLSAARILEFVKCPMVEPGIHAVFQIEADGFGQVRQEARQIVEGDQSAGTDRRGVGALEYPHEEVDALGRAQRLGDPAGAHLLEDGPRGGIFRQRLGQVGESPPGVRGDFRGERRHAALFREGRERGRLRADVAERAIEVRGRRAAGPDAGRVAPLRPVRTVPEARVPGAYEAREGREEIPGIRPAEHEPEGPAEDLFRIRGLEHEHVAHEPGGLERRAVFAHDGHVAREPELEGDHPHDPHEETVQRADERQVLARDDLAEHRGEIGLRQRASEGERGALFRRFPGVFRGIRQPFDETVEDFARRETRKRQGDDAFRLDAAENQRHETRHEGVGLARAGRCLHNRKRGYFHDLCASTSALWAAKRAAWSAIQAGSTPSAGEFQINLS